jgi:hypothetical protein
MLAEERPNGLELGCPAEAGKPSQTVRLTRRRFKPPLKRRPPGQSKILVIVQGFSELSGCEMALRHCRASTRLEPQDRFLARSEEAELLAPVRLTNEGLEVNRVSGQIGHDSGHSGLIEREPMK